MARYFKFKEMTRTDTGLTNIPNSDEIENIIQLMDMLDIIRSGLGSPITVNSGYRCNIVNKAVGGVNTSEHLLGKAADITCGCQANNKKMFEMIIDMQKRGLISFGQLIDEKNYK